MTPATDKTVRLTTSPGSPDTSGGDESHTALVKAPGLLTGGRAFSRGYFAEVVVFADNGDYPRRRGPLRTAPLTRSRAPRFVRVAVSAVKREGVLGLASPSLARSFSLPLVSAVQGEASP